MSSLTPLSALRSVIDGTTAPAFQQRYPNQDVVLLEPFDKDRDPRAGLHPAAEVQFLPRTLNQPVPVGRDARAVVQLDQPAVSRLHLVLAYTTTGWKVMDRSSNGSYLDGEKMPREQSVTLTYGVPVRLGKAAILRLFSPDGLHQLVRLHPGLTAGPAPSDPGSSTWRFRGAATTQGLSASDSGGAAGDFELDFEFDISKQSAPTSSSARLPAVMPPAPAPGASAAQPVEDIEFDFEVDGDGRGGFG